MKMEIAAIKSAKETSEHNLKANLEAEKVVSEKLIMDFQQHKSDSKKATKELQDALAKLQEERKADTTNLDQIRREKKELEIFFAAQIAEKDAKVATLTSECAAITTSMTAKLEALAEKLDASERKCALSEEAFNQEADRSESLQKQVQREKEVVANLTEKITEKDAKIEGLETRLDGKVNADAFDAERIELQLAIQRVEKLLHSKAAEAKSLRKQLIDMRGQIRTLLRIRPRLEDEVDSNVALEIVTDGSVVLEQNKIKMKSSSTTLTLCLVKMRPRSKCTARLRLSSSPSLTVTTRAFLPTARQALENVHYGWS